MSIPYLYATRTYDAAVRAAESNYGPQWYWSVTIVLRSDSWIVRPAVPKGN